MQMIDSLRSGRLGLKLELPTHFNVLSENDLSVEFFNESTQVHYWIHFWPHLHLNLDEEHRTNLERSLKWYAKYLFETFHQVKNPKDIRPPRTTDPSWSPLIDVDYLEIRGALALRTIHRMAYEAGHESILGHLLVPLQQGLFEVRVATLDTFTGYRESVHFDQFYGGLKPKDKKKFGLDQGFLQQQDTDSLQYDVIFPKHCLSRARAALLWFCNEADFFIAEPKIGWESGEVRLQSLGCSLTPPPRFVYNSPLRAGLQEGFKRVSFCATDGVENLSVWNYGKPTGEIDFLLIAEAIARTTGENSNIQELKITVNELPLYNEQPQVLAIMEGIGHVGNLRNVMYFFLDEAQRIWSLTWVSTPAVPLDAVTEELEATRRSFRLVSSQDSLIS